MTRGTSEFHDLIKDLMYQFAYDTESGGEPALTTGGLSVLEDAFEYLGWDDPHPIPEQKCEVDGCPKRATCGKLTVEGYKRLCGGHYETER